MVNTRRGRRSTADRDVNPVSAITGLTMARSFLASSSELRNQPRLFLILSQFERGDIAGGFKALDDIGPEFGARLESCIAFSQFTGFFKKIAFKKTNVDRKKVALASWMESEASCKRANKRILHYLVGHPMRFAEKRPVVSQVVNYAKEFIRAHIGELTPTRYEAILKLSRPGGGVCIGTKFRSNVAPVYKYIDSHWSVTDECKPILLDFLRLCPGLLQFAPLKSSGRGTYVIRTVQESYNRVSFVPKNAKTLRSIAVEPNVNLWFQLGVHEYLSRRLSRRGVCFTEDQRPNQLYAKLGSIHNDLSDTLATIDMKSASDRISTELVRYLLPSTWFDFLDSIRVKQSLLNGEIVNLNKFSSMGNGFTFVLQSLIFRALAEGCRVVSGSNGLTASFGDDVIIPSSAALLFSETMKELGLVVNTDKSFFFGPFRESCGTDWFIGNCVTPIKFEDESLRANDLYHAINFLERCPDSGAKAVRSLCIRELSRIKALRFGLPNEQLDSCVFTTFSYAKGSGSLVYSSNIQNYRFRVLRERGINATNGSEFEKYASALLTGKQELPIKGRTRYVLGWATQGVDSRWWVTN